MFAGRLPASISLGAIFHADRGSQYCSGQFQALQRQNLKREVPVSVTHFLAILEMIAVTDYCATLPALTCRRLASDARLKVLPRRFTSSLFRWRWHGTILRARNGISSLSPFALSLSKGACATTFPAHVVRLARHERRGARNFA